MGKRILLHSMITCLVLTGALSAGAQSRQAGIYEVKAAYLYNFAKFTEWPEAPLPRRQEQVAICVLGDDPFGSALNTIRNKTIDGRSVLVKLVREREEIRSCHVLFVSGSDAEHLAPIIAVAQDAHILTVSDIKDFARKGGMIALVAESDKVRFIINAGAAKRAGLHLSSQLLRLAVSVIE